MKEVGIGLLGFGTVGAGVVEGLQENGDLISARLGIRPVLRKVADVDLARDRGVKVDPALLTADAKAVIEDPAIDVVVELIGGTGVAREFVKRALELGKPVVTANKALLAKHGEEIFDLAEEKKVNIYFGASVGGGIPIVRALREGMVANKTRSMYGILNGTCNYILTRMEKEKMAFADALRAAQQEGFAEADPSLDVDGWDTAHKAVILASLAFGFVVPLGEVHVEGIRGLAETDLQYAADLGYRIKLLAVIKRDGNEVEVRVHPTLVAKEHVLASVAGVFNAVMLRSDLADDTVYYGRGAGRKPTASTVIADIADAARDLTHRSSRRVPLLVRTGRCPKLKESDHTQSRYYLRLSALDQAGVLAKIASALGKNHIGIASVLQKEAAAGRYVPLVVVTDTSTDRQVGKALEEIDALDVVGAKTVRIRIEDCG